MPGRAQPPCGPARDRRLSVGPSMERSRDRCDVTVEADRRCPSPQIASAIASVLAGSPARTSSRVEHRCQRTADRPNLAGPLDQQRTEIMNSQRGLDPRPAIVTDTVQQIRRPRGSRGLTGLQLIGSRRTHPMWAPSRRITWREIGHGPWLTWAQPAAESFRHVTGSGSMGTYRMYSWTWIPINPGAHGNHWVLLRRNDTSRDRDDVRRMRSRADPSWAGPDHCQRADSRVRADGSADEFGCLHRSGSRRSG